MIALVVLLLLLLASLGIPLFVILGLAALLGFQFVSGVDPSVILAEVYRLTSAPVFVAIPLFIYAGYVMAEGKASSRWIRLAQASFGWVPGGLGIVCVVTCAIFTSLTGASGITIIALGGVLLPALMKEGYGEQFSTGLLTTAGSLGLFFPPSLPIILYGLVAKVNVEELFVAGVVPGILMMALLGGYSILRSWKRNIPRSTFSWGELGGSLRAAVWDLPLPIILLGGIYGGVFTASEAAAVTAFYVTFVEVVVYRDISLRKLPDVMLESIVVKGGVIIILGVALGLTNFLVDQQVPMKVLDLLRAHVESRTAFLIGLNVFLLLVGSLMDIFSAIVVVVPIIDPVARSLGVDPIHLGVLFLANLEIGYAIPPAGINLLLASYRFREPLPKVFRSTLPFVGLMLLGLLTLTYFPEILLRSHVHTIQLPF